MKHATPAPLAAIIVILGLIAVPAVGQYTLIWADEFDNGSLDPNNWECMIGDGTSYGLPAGWGNNELEYYTSRTDNVFVSGGVLHVVARKESYQGYAYTSARLRSLDKREFLYGRIEASIKVPTGQGYWPAFWMLPTDSPYGGWAASGEIDIMESVNVATTVYGTIHYGGAWPNNVSSGSSYQNGSNFGSAYHVYALEWEPDAMRWYCDGNLYYTVTSSTWYSTAAPSNDRAPFDTPFHILLNVAVGGNWPGSPNDSTVFPQQLLVDYIRVYQLPAQSPYSGTAQAIPGRIDVEDFDLGAEGEAYHDCDTANQGGQYRTSAGVDIEVCSEGGYDVGWMCGGEWMEYTVNVAQAGPYVIETRVASQSTGGQFQLLFSGVDKTGDIVVPVTGDWQAWISVWARAELPAGVQIMRFANAATAHDYNVNYVRFYSAADLDRDGSVAADDMAAFFSALAGPDVTTPPAGCPAQTFQDADLDLDEDVDLDDFSTFQTAFGQ